MHRGRGSLPDLEPLQTAVTERLQKEMLARMDQISPEAMMRTWLSFMPQGAEQMQKLFTETFTGVGLAKQ